MTRPVSALLSVTFVLAAGAVPARASQGAGIKGCSEHRRRVSDLTAEGVACDTARWVARTFDRKVTKKGEWPDGEAMPVGRFRCRARDTGYETYRIRCRRAEDEVVRFNWGV